MNRAHPLPCALVAASFCALVACGEDVTPAAGPGTTAVTASGELQLHHGGPLATALHLRWAPTGDGAIEGIAALDHGEPVAIEGTLDGEVARFEPFEVRTAPPWMPEQSFELRFLTLSSTPGSGGARVRGDGFYAGPAPEVFAEEPPDSPTSVPEATTTHDHELSPEVIEFGVDWDGGPGAALPVKLRRPGGAGRPAPTEPLDVLFGEPVLAAELTTERLGFQSGLVDHPFEATPIGVVGDVAQGVRVTVPGHLPLGTRLSLVPTSGGVSGMTGGRWTERLDFDGPPRSVAAIVPTSFEDDQPSGFTGPDRDPAVITYPPPIADDGRRVMDVVAPGAWGMAALPEDVGTLSLRLTYLTHGKGHVYDLPESELGRFGFSVEVIGAAGSARHEASWVGVELVCDHDTSQRDLCHAAPEVVEIDVSELAGQEVLIVLSPRSYPGLSPLTGHLMVDRIDFKP